MKNKSIASLSLRKLMLSALVAAPLATLPVPLWALPTSQANLDAQVTNKSAGVTVTYVNNGRVDVTSSATNSVVNWANFGGGGMTIGGADTVAFTLPSTTASVLNAVPKGASKSTIDGTVSANGNLYIMNPNGIIVNGTINANSVGLSTVDETDYYFLANGKLSYVPNQGSTVDNEVTVSPTAKITAASGTGNVWVTAKLVELAGTVDAANVTVNTQNGGSVVLGKGGNLTVGNNLANASTLKVITNGAGTITVGDVASNVVVYGSSAELTTANGAIAKAGTGFLQLGNGTGNATLTTNSGTADTNLLVNSNGSKQVNVTATAKDLTLTSTAGSLGVGATLTGLLSVTAAGNIALNASTVAGTVTVDSNGGNITSGGNVAATGAVSLEADAGKHITFAGKAGGGLTILGAGSTRLGNVTINSTDAIALSYVPATNLTVTAAGNITQSAGQDVAGKVKLEATGGKNVTISQNISAATNVEVIGKDITYSGGTLPTGAGSIVTFTATGEIAIGSAINVATLGLTAGGNITQTAAIAAGALTVDAASATLTNAANEITSVTIKNGAKGISITEADVAANGLVLAKNTAATGNVTIVGGGAVVFGAADADTLTFGGDLSVTAGAGTNITDATNNISVTGNTTLTTSGAGTVVIDGGTLSGALVASGLNHSFAKVNITTVGQNATIAEKGTLDLGRIDLGAGNLTAYATTAITNSDVITAANVLIGAGTATAAGDITLTGKSGTGAASNQISGKITLLDDLKLLSSASGIVGNYLAKSVTVVNGVASANLLDIAANVYGQGSTAAISLTQTAAGVALNAGALNTSGAVTLISDTGAITANTAGNKFTSVTVTAKGAVTVASDADLTANAALITGAGAVSFTAGNNLTIGSYKSNSTGLTTFTATKAITDSVSNIGIYDAVAFNGASVSLTQAGHSFGAVSATTTGNGAVTIAESGTMKIGAISTGSGNVTLSSTNLDVIQIAAGGVSSTGSTVVNALSGLINLNGSANAVAKANLSAVGNLTLANTVNVELGTVTTTGGTLTVTNTGKNITQKASTAINAYGNTTLTGAAITLENSGNNFGALSVTATGAASVKETAEMNLKAVSATGAFTAVSETGSITDSGTLTVGGAASFTADAGNIVLDTAANNFASVKLKTTGNAQIVDSAGLQLDTSTITGTLVVNVATGNLTQAGALAVGGDVTFMAPAGAITLNNTQNMFGGVRFNAGSNVLIDELTTFKLRAGSSVTGATTINTGADFITSDEAGGSSFSGNLTINAIGTIIPGAGSMLVTGTLTVNSDNTKDLSKLSYVMNLTSKPVTFLGTGTNIKPPDHP